MEARTLDSIDPRILSAEEPNSPDRLGRVFDQSHQRLFRLACRLARDVEQAHDLVQEAFLRAAHQGRSLPADDRGAEAWLVRVLINLFRDEARKRSVRLRAAEETDLTPAAPAGPDSAVIAKRSVRQALATLAPRRRAIVTLCELEELSVREVARMLTISEVTVRWHLALGRRQLAAQLAETPSARRQP